MQCFANCLPPWSSLKQRKRFQMSSINMDQNLNNNPEQVQGQTEIHPKVEKECDAKDQSTVIHGVTEGDNAKSLLPDVHKVCSSPSSCETREQIQVHDLDQNLNTVDTCPSVNVKKEEPECDTSNTIDVENVSNSLAENNITSCETNVSDNCDSSSDKKPNSSVPTIPPTEKLIQDTLIHKVNELDISGRVNQNIQTNKSAVILKKETDSLRNLLVYGTSSDEEDDFEKNWQVLTVLDSCSEESESDSSESEESSSDNDDDMDDITTNIIYGQTNKGAIKKDTKTTGSNSKSLGQNIEVLPPVPNLSTLNINYDTEEFFVMGHVQGVIDTLVTVEAIPGTPAYDLDTYLFIEDKCSKKPLGAVDDVLGPVTAPFYCVRFNNPKEIQDLNVKIGLKVYSAPKSQYTHYVFVKELMKIKGSDASWIGDTEVPPEVAAELSDDEDEHNLDTVRKAQKRKHGSLERHKQFEKSMNHCNTLNTRVAQLVDAHRRLPRPNRYSEQSQRSLLNEFQLYGNRPPVPFDPTVPPPGFYNYSRESNTPQIRPPMHWGWIPPLYRSTGRSSSTPSTQGQNNSANYYTNNAGRNPAAGPSTQPY